VQSESGTIKFLPSLQVEVRVWVPVPQLLLQVLHALETHEYVQAAVLHDWEEDGAVPAPEQNEGATTLLLDASLHVTARIWVPPPHVTEHKPKSVDAQEQAPLLHVCWLAGLEPALLHSASSTVLLLPSTQVTVRV